MFYLLDTPRTSFHVSKYVHPFSDQIILHWLFNHYVQLDCCQLFPIMNDTVIKSYSYCFESKSLNSLSLFLYVHPYMWKFWVDRKSYTLPMFSVNGLPSHIHTSNGTQFGGMLIVLVNVRLSIMINLTNHIVDPSKNCDASFP